jgi:alpha-L-rhamnosidase
MDLAAFSRKYAGDLRGTLGDVGMYGIYAPGTSKVNPGYGPGWSDAGIIVPWTSWMQTGDKAIIQQNWSGMARYLATILAANPDYLWTKNTGTNFGDWLSPEGSTANGLIATAYWAYDSKLMSQMAHAMGRTDEEQKYDNLYARIREAFRRSYVHPNGVVGWEQSSSKPGLAESQTGYVLALHMDLLPQEMRAQAAQRLVDRIAANGWKLGTGFLGTPYLLGVLADTGHADVAYRLLLNTVYPSWGYMVEHGATTMWERWNGDKMLGDPGMNSFNHYAYGAVGEWLYRYAAGVDTSALSAGFHTILLHPNFDARLGSLDFTYESRYGKIHSQWTAQASSVEWHITIPANTTANLLIPSFDKRSYTIDGKPLAESPLAKQLTTSGTSRSYQLEAGSYTIHVQQ